MLAAPLTLETLVPHRGLMLLISKIIDYDENRASAAAVVSEGWPLTTSAGANPLVLIELVAQTAAINNGWELIRQHGPGGERRGWIAGIKSAQLFVDRIAVGTTVLVEACNEFQYDNYREIRGVAKIGDEIAAEVYLQLVQASGQ